MNHVDARTFLRQVADQLSGDERRAEAVTVVVFQELRDRLTPGGGSHVAAQLPRGLKRLWTENGRRAAAVEPLYRLELLGEVMQRGALSDSAAAEGAVLAVFTALQRLLASTTDTAGTTRDIVGQLPPDLETLWRAAGDGIRRPQNAASRIRWARDVAPARPRDSGGRQPPGRVGPAAPVPGYKAPGRQGGIDGQ